jgi:16S rRNA (guanine527-N7)-methyltransferase
MAEASPEEALTIIREAAEIGIRVEAGVAKSCARHLAMVYEANEQFNLTRIARERAVSLHVLDSLVGLPTMEGSPSGPWLDLGSGAGYPGVVLAVAGERRVDLVESTGKKARFLEVVCRELCPKSTVLAMRAEEAAITRRESYAAVCARAVSELPALVELAAPLLLRDGILVCWKGDPSSEELERGSLAAGLAGMRYEGTVPVRIQGAGDSRRLIVYRKTGSPRVPLPRRIGLAQSQPLA